MLSEQLRAEAQNLANTEPYRIQLVRALLYERPEHPLAHKLFRAIKDYVWTKRRLHRWLQGKQGIDYPLGHYGSLSVEVARDNVESIMGSMHADLDSEEIKALTLEMGHAIGGRSGRLR